MERERNVLQRTRDAPTISILRSNTSFSTLIERLASGKFFNERKKIISSPFHFYGERNYSPTNGTTDFSLPRRGSRRELRGLLLIRTYVRDRANVSVNLRYFSRPLWPTRMVAMNLGIFLKKGKKKKEKKERTSSFRGSFEERETMLLDEKQLGGREMWEIGKGNDRGRGKYASGSNVDGDAIDYDLWRGNARIDGPTDVLRFGKIWCGENLDVTRDRWDGKFFEIPPPFIPCFWSFLSWMIITRIATPLQS